MVPDPSYVDLFDHLRRTSVFREAIVEQIVSDNQKDDFVSNQCRQRGNELIQQNEFKLALEQYNKSLCFAEHESIALSFAFANRSFCFLRLELYEECLVDIELAVNAHYPDHLKAKLEQRKLTCLKQMKTSIKRTPLEPQLSFEADPAIPCMANVLRIVRSVEFGRHFEAQSNIKEDQVLMIEEPLVKLIDENSKYKRCHSCLKEYTNVIPCAKCTEAIFCSEECSIDIYHKFECNMKMCKSFEGKTGRATQNGVKFLLRTVGIALETFSSSEELMKLVDLFRADSSSNDIVAADGTTEALFGIFLTHNHDVSYEIGKEKLLIISCIAYDFILGHPTLKLKFQTKNVQRFLMHLLTHFAAMFTANNILLQDWSEKWFDVIEHVGKETFGTGLFNISSYFNHACMPNVIRLTTTNHTIIKTIRPIKDGEQIFVRYGIDPNWTTPRRQQYLFSLCGFHCKCSMCMSNGPHLNEISVITSEFSNLSMEMGPLIFLGVKEAHKWKSMKEKLFTFVKKYADMPMSKSLILSYEYIRMILARELSCPT